MNLCELFYKSSSLIFSIKDRSFTFRSSSKDSFHCLVSACKSPSHSKQPGLILPSSSAPLLTSVSKMYTWPHPDPQVFWCFKNANLMFTTHIWQHPPLRPLVFLTTAMQCDLNPNLDISRKAVQLLSESLFPECRDELHPDGITFFPQRDDVHGTSFTIATKPSSLPIPLATTKPHESRVKTRSEYGDTFVSLLQVKHCYRKTVHVLSVCFLTIEVDGSDVVEQHLSLHGVHVVADSGAAGTQILVHVVQSVSHGVDRIDYKLNLSFLLVERVPSDPLVTCRNTHCVI